MSDAREQRESTEPHEATEFDAGNGQGTVSGPPKGDVQQRPVMDGSTQSAAEEHSVDNPRRGMEDPGLVRDTETGKKTPTPDEDE